MPGRPFQSSLEPHLETIRALRLKRRTWRQVAETLKTECGLEIDPAAIYKFFKRRVRPSARQPLGFPTVSATGGSRAALSPPVPIPDDAATDLSFEPIDPDAENPFKMRKRRAQPSTASDAEAAPSDAAPATPAKKYVFIPKPERPSIFSEEDLQLNDPLAIEPFGKPVDSVAQNLFRKKKSAEP